MQTLSNWHNKANQGKLAGTEQYDPNLMAAIQEIKQFKWQLKVTEEERELLKGYRVLCEKQSVKYAFMKDNHLFSITTMCRVLYFKTLNYYDRLSHDISDKQIYHNHCEPL